MLPAAGLIAPCSAGWTFVSMLVHEVEEVGQRLLLARQHRGVIGVAGAAVLQGDGASFAFSSLHVRTVDEFCFV